MRIAGGRDALIRWRRGLRWAARGAAAFAAEIGRRWRGRATRRLATLGLDLGRPRRLPAAGPRLVLVLLSPDRPGLRTGAPPAAKVVVVPAGLGAGGRRRAPARPPATSTGHPSTQWLAALVRTRPAAAPEATLASLPRAVPPVAKARSAPVRLPRVALGGTRAANAGARWPAPLRPPVLMIVPGTSRERTGPRAANAAARWPAPLRPPALMIVPGTSRERTGPRAGPRPAPVPPSSESRVRTLLAWAPSPRRSGVSGSPAPLAGPRPVPRTKPTPAAPCVGNRRGRAALRILADAHRWIARRGRREEQRLPPIPQEATRPRAAGVGAASARPAAAGEQRPTSALPGTRPAAELGLADLEKAIAARLERRLDQRIAVSLKSALAADTEVSRAVRDGVYDDLHDRMVLERERRG